MTLHQRDTAPEPTCQCWRYSPWTRDDVFIWRGDPTWWSCMSCDGRVRPLTADEAEARKVA